MEKKKKKEKAVTQFNRKLQAPSYLGVSLSID